MRLPLPQALGSSAVDWRMRGHSWGNFWLWVGGFMLCIPDPIHAQAVRYPGRQWPVPWHIFVLALISAWKLARLPRGRLRECLVRAWPMTALIVVAVASVRWSADGQMPMFQGPLLIVEFLFAIAFTASNSLARVVDVIATATAILAAISTWWSISNPELHAAGINWMGLYNNRNGLGGLAALGVPMALVAWRGSRQQWWRWIVYAGPLAINVAALFGSRSKTALIGLVITVMIWLYSLVRGTVRRFAARILGYVAVTIVAGLAIQELFRRNLLVIDRTLSGRTPIWRALAEPIRLRWNLGYGLGTFHYGHRGYLELAARRAEAIVGGGSSPLRATAHNGFVQTQLDLGIIGFAMLCGVVLLGFMRWLPVLGRGPRGISSAGAVAFTIFTTSNLTESQALWPTVAPFLVVATVFLARPAPPRKRWWATKQIEDDVIRVWRRSHKVLLPAFCAILLVGFVFAKRPAYVESASLPRLVQQVEDRGLTVDSKRRYALNRMAIAVDQRPAIGDSLKWNVRDLLEWAKRGEDDLTRPLWRVRPRFRELTDALDSVAAAGEPIIAAEESEITVPAETGAPGLP